VHDYHEDGVSGFVISVRGYCLWVVLAFGLDEAKVKSAGNEMDCMWDDCISSSIALT
jgi:hypothetical protein